MYIVKKRCIPSGRRRLKSTTNHAMNATITTPSVQMPSQMKCGIARKRRKKTVSRERSRSSMTRSCTGWSRRIVERLPEVQTRERTVRTPRIRDQLDLGCLWQLVEPIVDLDCLADPEVTDGQHVGPAQVEHQEHVDRPAPEPLDG